MNIHQIVRNWIEDYLNEKQEDLAKLWHVEIVHSVNPPLYALPFRLRLEENGMVINSRDVEFESDDGDSIESALDAIVFDFNKNSMNAFIEESEKFLNAEWKQRKLKGRWTVKAISTHNKCSIGYYLAKNDQVIYQNFSNFIAFDKIDKKTLTQLVEIAVLQE